MQVPLLDLQSQYSHLKDDIQNQINDVLESQRCIGGPKVEKLERTVAERSGCKFGLGVSSGTDALLNVLMSLDIGPGDEVITTPFTFFATAGCIARTGARPVFVDIEPETFNIDPAGIEAVITKNTKAILPVHLFGQVCDMDQIMAIAGVNSLAVVEDAAQSISAQYKDAKAGGFGTAGCMSFYPTKNLGGIGDGGMIVTNNENLYEKMKIMRDHGQKPQYHYSLIGGNFRLDAIQAAALLAKIPYLDEWSRARRKHAEYYNKRFKDTGVQTPVIHPDCVSVYNQYVVRVPRRDDLLTHLRHNDVGCLVYYPLGLHQQECFKHLGYKEGDFPETEKAAQEVIALPVYPELTQEMQDYVVEKVLEFYPK